MPAITYQGKTYECADGATVLDCLTAGGVAPPSSCRSGVCQTCLMRAVKGAPPPAAQKDLKATLIAQGYFLACICRPEGDLEVTLPSADVDRRLAATLLDKNPLNNDIVELIFACDAPLEYQPGQFIALWRSDGLSRTYSLASLPQETPHQIALHVRRVSGGRMSNWLHDELPLGAQVEISAARGNCFYLAGKPDQPLVLVGTGSGLAPLWGILRHALRNGHRGPVWLYHGSHTVEGLYLQQSLRDLETRYDNFHYVPCISGTPAPDGYLHERANTAACEQHADMSGYRIFICGHPQMVAAMKRDAYLNGAALQDIHADPFVINQ
jgi:ferredoxin-NADP reductase/ferredoxin